MTMNISHWAVWFCSSSVIEGRCTFFIVANAMRRWTRQVIRYDEPAIRPTTPSGTLKIGLISPCLAGDVRSGSAGKRAFSF